MEDSGIDSEDKLSNICDEQRHSSNDSVIANDEAIASHMDDLHVVFRNIAPNESVYRENTSTDESATTSIITRQPPPNTCRILQRKLELKVERAKRNYSQYQEDNAKKTLSSNLIPIDRLPIPGDFEHKPLVDYKSDSSDPDEISFFPAKLKASRNRNKKAELSDTFSIQEMTIESDLESEDDSRGSSQNLELLPPMLKRSFIEKFCGCFICKRYSS